MKVIQHVHTTAAKLNSQIGLPNPRVTFNPPLIDMNRELNWIQFCELNSLELLYQIISLDILLTPFLFWIPQPPENELQKIHETPMLSEHQLRVQASLQKLNIPDWYRQYNDGSRGDLRSPTSPAANNSSVNGQSNYRKRTPSGADTLPPSGSHAKWTGLNSKTTSLSSLGGGSQRYDQNSSLMLSPSSHSHHGGTTTISTGYSRWVLLFRCESTLINCLFL